MANQWTVKNLDGEDYYIGELDDVVVYVRRKGGDDFRHFFMIGFRAACLYEVNCLLELGLEIDFETPDYSDKVDEVLSLFGAKVEPSVIEEIFSKMKEEVNERWLR